MPRIRTIKPDFFKSEDVSALPMRARLTWIGLWTQCDDHGRYKDSARLIKGDLWSLEDVSLADIEEDLAALAAANRIARYQVDGKHYLVIVNWHKHQAINRPSKGVHPAPPFPMASADPNDPNHCKHCALPGSGGRPAPAEQYASEPRGTAESTPHNSVSTHGTLTEHSRQEGKGREGKGREGNARASQAQPSPPEPPEQPPPPTCPKHIDDPDPPPCRPCGKARQAREAWDREQLRVTTLRRQAEAHAQAETNAIATANCPRCDQRGYLPHGRICNHEPEASQGAAAAARQAARAAARRREPGNAVAELDALTASMAPLSQPPGDPPDEPLAPVIPLHQEEQNP